MVADHADEENVLYFERAGGPGAPMDALKIAVYDYTSDIMLLKV
jgi:hypothetical protein